MGQARNRGSREDRVQEAIARRKEQADRRIAGFQRAERNVSELAAALRAADPRPVRQESDGLQVVVEAAYSGYGVADGDVLSEFNGDAMAARLLSGHISIVAGT
jgi:ribosomal protein S5